MAGQGVAQSKVTELELMNLFFGAVSRVLPGVRFFRRQVLRVELEPGLHVSAGIPGQADAYFIVKGTALHGECEFKSASGRLSAAQLRWKAFCESWGILFLELKAQRGETSEATISRWIQELEEALK